jgi:hypothetical protein
MRCTLSFSSSTTDASSLLLLEEIAVQRARKMRDRVFISAYVISEAALVKAVDATEN